MHDTLTDAIGNTPLIKINFDSPATIYAKLEYLNPSGSIKDRVALYIIEQAEKKGRLKPGGTIIEASSGNQGIATAMIGAAKGYHVIITVSQKVSSEKKAAIQAYGAEVIVCPTTLLLEDAASYHSRAMQIHRNTPNSFMLNQYLNLDNAQAHYTLTGPELWQQTKGTITHLCAAVGSGGTISGTGAFLKEQNPRINVIAVDAAHSYRSTCGKPKPSIIEGLGVELDSPVLNNAVIDEFLLAHDNESIAMAKYLAHNHGLLVGPASGAVAYTARSYAQDLTKNDTLVMLFTDSGRAYLSKGYY